MKNYRLLFFAILLFIVASRNWSAYSQKNLYIKPVAPIMMGQCDFVILEIGDTFSTKDYFNATSTYYRLIFKKNKLKYWHKSVGHSVIAYKTIAEENILLNHQNGDRYEDDDFSRTYFSRSGFIKRYKRQKYYNRFLNLIDSNFFDKSNREKQRVLDSIVAITLPVQARKKK